jgi:nicotinamide riboside transporter PnuC
MNITLETFGVITTILAIVGVYYNNRLNRKCFYFWIVSNLISCALHCITGLWSLAIRDAVFLAMAFEGLRKWKAEQEKPSPYEIARFPEDFPPRGFA